LTLILIYYLVYYSKSRLSFKRNDKKIKERARIIKKYLNSHGKIPTYNIFKYDIQDTDIAEWRDIQHLTSSSSLEDIEKVLI
jgi:hypothetical protein